ncbi:MAG: DNA/RNA non-specific endonuclease [Treponema sp.]|nr:DNA/RNA non-specific endonuclease [Treponema sp.]
MEKLSQSLFLFAAVLLLSACSTLSQRQQEEAEAHEQTQKLKQDATGRIHREIEKGCVTAEEYNYLTGIWNSGQDSLALQIPLCKATSHLLNQTKRNSFTVVGLDGNEETEAESEKDEKPPKDHELHTYAGYTLCYRESYEQSEWVAYSLARSQLEHKVTGRTNDFRADTLISTGSAKPADYKGSGFDRGHLAPAADMAWSLKSAHDSFLMSNMSPQAPSFNRVIWKLLEEAVRNWAQQYGTIYVVTGPVLEKESNEYQSIGESEVAVPEYFYKALLVFIPVYAESNSAPYAISSANEKEIEAYRVQCAAFIVPNKGSGKDIYKFICSVDLAEERTGLDFFANLPDEVEDLAESECGEIFLEP